MRHPAAPPLAPSRNAKRRLARAAVLAVALAAGGCALPAETARLSVDASGLPPAAAAAAVPFVAQDDAYCGPAALAMVLGWQGIAADQADLAAEAFTAARSGALAADMVTAARRHGRLAVRLDRLDQILAELAAGHPVVVLENQGLSWLPVWHYAVAVGYDLPRRQIRLHSGQESDMALALGTFEHGWDRAGRWALAVLPPATLPARATPAAVLAAAAGLERAGQPAAAAQAYAAAAARWPDNPTAPLGLGNARYALGDLAGAAAAFAAATRRDPAAPAAWNNLAQALIGLGRADEAGAAARAAVALDDAPVFAATLAEAERMGR